MRSVFAGALAWLAALRFAAALEVPLTVEEPAEIARQRAPVCSGVCFPPHTARPTQKFALREGEREIPLQATPLVVDREGYLRWLLLDFQLDIAAGETKRLTLASARASLAPQQKITVSDTPQQLVVNTGPLVFTISKAQPFALFSDVRVRGRAALAGPGRLEYVEAKTGQRYLAGPPSKVALEYAGPLRVTVRVEGQFRGAGDCLLNYITRITAWAGRCDVLVNHVLANSNPEQVYYANLKTASIVLRPKLAPGAEAILGADRPLRAPLSSAPSFWLHMGKVNRYYSSPITDAARAGFGDRVKWQGADPEGWLALARGGRAILVSDRDFCGDPPRRLSVTPSGELNIEYISAKFNTGRGVPFKSDHFWLYDMTHKVAELLIDFDAPDDPAALSARARAVRSRLLAVAPPEWYSRCDVHATGRFGTLEDEKRVYELWGWRYEEKQVPRKPHMPGLFVRWEDNHYESEADSPEGLLLMFLRTGQRGYFDLGEAWARYHASLQAWRSDGWVFDDGAIWFPQGGPLGTRMKRKPPQFKYQHWGKGTGDDQELWHLVQAKACYCHFYGAGLVDYFLLTGDRDALEAALDLVEVKNSEFRKHRQLTPGKSPIASIRGFGRGFYVITHVLEAVPNNKFVADLARLCRDTLWRTPMLDERGFVIHSLGRGFNPKKHLPPLMKQFMERRGITLDKDGWLSDREGNRWPVVCLGGTWQHTYVQQAAFRYAQLFDDEDMRDFAYAFGRFAAKYMLSDKCHQTHYYMFMDIPIRGEPWDAWKFEPEHMATTDGEGCVHSGYYTRFFPDAITMAYLITGQPGLLERAREFWHYGSKRRYRTKHLVCGWDAVGKFADHRPPKDDDVLSTCRMFYAWAHPRRDRQPPQPVRDLRVLDVGGGKATVAFTAPQDAGGGRVARYQVKCAELPIVSYDEFDYAKDSGRWRNFWKAYNLRGEPCPSAPGTAERFVVSGVPEGITPLYFVVVSYDEANNRSALSNVVCVQ